MVFHLLDHIEFSYHNLLSNLLIFLLKLIQLFGSRIGESSNVSILKYPLLVRLSLEIIKSKIQNLKYLPSELIS